MCPDCLPKLYIRLSGEAKKLLTVLPATKNDAMHKAELSYSIANKAFTELEACMFVEYVEQGRSKMYTLTEHYTTMKKGSKKEPIKWKSF